MCTEVPAREIYTNLNETCKEDIGKFELRDRRQYQAGASSLSRLFSGILKYSRGEICKMKRRVAV
jgi:hypothetical protein